MNLKLVKALKLILVLVGLALPLILSAWQNNWLSPTTSEPESAPDNVAIEIKLSEEQLKALEGEQSTNLTGQLTQTNPQLANHPLITDQTINPEIATTLINFQANNIIFTDISLPATTVISLIMSNGQQTLINDKPELVEEQLFKLRLILQYFDFESFDESIQEIDVRYRLPVLRTTQLIFETDQNDLIEP